MFLSPTPIYCLCLFFFIYWQGSPPRFSSTPPFHLPMLVTSMSVSRSDMVALQSGASRADSTRMRPFDSPMMAVLGHGVAL